MRKVDLRNYLDQRLPIGLLLLAIAAFCIWKGRGPNGLETLILGACVGFIGLLAVGERYFVLIDERAGVLKKKRGLVLAVTLTSLAITEVERVRLSSYTYGRRRNSDGATRYRLCVLGPKGIELANYGDEWYARKVGERLSTALRVPFDNTIYERSSGRQADQLDLPLAERWRAAGKVKERPALPEGSQLSIEDLGAQLRVRFPADPAGLQGTIAVAVILVAGAVLLYPFLKDLSDYLFFYGFFGCALLLLGAVALACCGRSRLIFTDRSIRFRHGEAPFERSIDLMSIEEMIAGEDAIQLVSDSAKLAIGWPPAKQDREFLAAFVAHEIARRHPRGGS